MVFTIWSSEILGTWLNDELGAQAKEKFLNNKLISDVQFKVGDGEIPAHRALISARCPALSSLFKKGDAKVEIEEGIITLVFH